MEIDIDEGFETKIVYDRRVNANTQVRIIFLSDKESRTFDLRLWEGGCIFHGCTQQTFNMDSVIDGISFILKIYRGEEKISIEVDNQKKVEIDISEASTVHCYSFWRDQDITSLKYDPVSEDVATQYKYKTSDDSDAEDQENDNDDDDDNDDEEDDSGNDDDDGEGDSGNDDDDEEDDSGKDDDDGKDDSGNDDDDGEDDSGNDDDDGEDESGNDDDDKDDSGNDDDENKDDNFPGN